MDSTQGFSASLSKHLKLISTTSVSQRGSRLRAFHEFLAKNAQEIKQRKQLLGVLIREIDRSLDESKVIGVELIRIFVDIDVGDVSQTVLYFSEKLLKALPATSSEVSNDVVRGIKFLLDYASTAMDLTTQHAERALSWLSAEDTGGFAHEAALLTMRALTTNAPWFLRTSTLLERYDVLTHIRFSLQSSSPTVRQLSAEMLERLLELELLMLTSETMKELLDELSKRIDSASTDHAHGAFLALRCLLASTSKRNLCSESAARIASILFSAIPHTDASVIHIVVELLAKLPFAARDFLVPCFSALCSFLSPTAAPDTQTVAIKNLKDLAQLCGSSTELLEQMTSRVTQLLNAPAARPSNSDVFECLVAFGRYADSSWSEKILDKIISDALNVEESEGVTDLQLSAFRAAKCIAPDIIREYWAQMLSRAHHGLVHVRTSESILNSLRSIECLSIGESLELLGLVTEQLLEYLHSSDPEIRIACLTTAMQVAKDNTETSAIVKLSRHVRVVVEKVLQLLISDASTAVRLAVLDHLHTDFDFYLALGDSLEVLLLATHDINQAVGEAVLKVLCRLASANRGAIAPSLLQMQSNAIRDLKSWTSVTATSSSIRLLLLTVQSAFLPTQLVEFERFCVERLSCVNSSSLAVSFLDVLSAVFSNAQPSQPHLEDELIFQLIVSRIADERSIGIQVAALHLFRSYVRYIALPRGKLLDMPILSTLSDYLNADSEVVRREAVRILGVIGAIDSAKIRELCGRMDEEMSGFCPQPSTPDIGIHQLRPPYRAHPKIAAQQPSITTYFLVQLISHASTREQQIMALNCISEVLLKLSNEQRIFIANKLIPLLLHWLRDTEKIHLHPIVMTILKHICQLLKQSQEMVKKFGKELSAALQEYSSTAECSAEAIKLSFIQLLTETAKVLPELGRHHLWTVSFVVQTLYEEHDNLKILVAVLSALEAFPSVFDRDVLNIIPQVIELLVSDSSPHKEVASHCLNFLQNIVNSPAMKDRSPFVIQSLVAALETADGELANTILNILCQLLVSVGTACGAFIGQLEDLVRRKGIQHEPFQRLSCTYHSFPEPKMRFPSPQNSAPTTEEKPVILLVSSMLSLHSFQLVAEVAETLQIPQSHLQVLSFKLQGGQVNVEISFQSIDELIAFRRAATEDGTFKRRLGIVTVGEKRKIFDFTATSVLLKAERRSSSWQQWYYELGLELLRSSPDASHREAWKVAEINNHMLRNMFRFALAAVVGELEAKQREQLMGKLTNAVRECQSHEVLPWLLNFAEFMELEKDHVGSFEASEMKRIMKISVTRPTTDIKFGINYERDQRGMVVTKVMPGGPGARANVPIGALLLEINGHPVTTTNDVTTLNKDQTNVTLTLLHSVINPSVKRQKPFLSLDVLASVTAQRGLNMRALHYYEIILEEELSKEEKSSAQTDALLDVMETCVNLCASVGIPNHADGIATVAEKRVATDTPSTLPRRGRVLEKLARWSQARLMHEKVLKLKESSTPDLGSLQGLVRCHRALGEFERMIEIYSMIVEVVDPMQRNQLASQCGDAAFYLGLWNVALKIDSEGALRPIARAAHLLHSGNPEKAHETILKYRSELEAQILSQKDPFESRELLVQLQHVTHFKEVLSYPYTNEDRKLTLRQSWRRRLFAMEPNAVDWQTAIAINSLVLTPAEDFECKLGFINVCRESEWHTRVECTLCELFDVKKFGDVVVSPATPPELVLRYFTHVNRAGIRKTALQELRAFAWDIKTDGTSEHDDALAECFGVLGEWTCAQHTPTAKNEALNYFKRATELGPKKSLMWHKFGVVNCILGYRKPREARFQFYATGITALFRATELGDAVLGIQDTLRVLSIWFSYSQKPEIQAAVTRGIETLPTTAWLRVIPQLVARLGSNNENLRGLLCELLSRVGKEFPQALIPSLTASSARGGRKTSLAILEAIKDVDETLVQQTSLIFHELVRIAILWPEKWAEALASASKKEKDSSFILDMLKQLFTELDTPKTPNERTFQENYGVALKRGRNALLQVRTEQAWSFLRQVFLQLEKNNKGMRSLTLADTSPALLALNECSVAVPSTFEVGKELVTIHSFVDGIVVLQSKQKPRRFTVVGNDGRHYRFLLKGHEDLRQDERVVQLFELMNTLLRGDAAAAALGLRIVNFGVVPLSNNVGIIEWVEQSETIFHLIENRRNVYGPSVYQEIDMIVSRGNLRSIDLYHSQPHAVRRELLSYVFSHTPSDELRSVFWERNSSSESWLNYRQRYTHSMAVMSMVGYVLGLGDRHLNNLMITNSGLIVHIDFGDCFEIAMHRRLFPERVPFRLTRLLSSAMGVAGVEGSFLRAAERVMSLLRRNKGSVSSVLETFVYDPLLNWRLDSEAEKSKPPESVPEGGKVTLSSSISKRMLRIPSENDFVDAWDEISDIIGAIEEVTDIAGDIAFPEHLSLSAAVSKIKETYTEGNLPAAAAWLRYTTQLHPMPGSQLEVPPKFDEEQSIHDSKNKTAREVLLRVQAKLRGEEFGIKMPNPTTPTTTSSTSSMQQTPESSPSIFSFLSLEEELGTPQANPTALPVEQHVARLIAEAQSIDNLANAYITGWAPFW